jgi:hypothetical protein
MLDKAAILWYDIYKIERGTWQYVPLASRNEASVNTTGVATAPERTQEADGKGWLMASKGWCDARQRD